jgi:2,3-diketo-5-methylthio-1-phosphopentane phosphatase
MEKYIVFIDFDNTISLIDVFDDLISRFSSQKARCQELEAKWQRQEIGSRRCLEGQIATLAISRKQLDSYLKRVKIDPYFKGLRQFFSTKKIKSIVLSDNFNYVVKNILSQRGVNHLPIFSNQLWFSRGRIKVKFPFQNRRCHACGHCKKETIEHQLKNGFKVVYIGDGRSDFCPAKFADIIFAKGELLEYCRKEKIACLAYRNFKDIQRYFKKIF